MSKTPLLSAAGFVVEEAIGELPDELRQLASGIPVLLFEDMPSHLIEDGLDPDTLGLFEGEAEDLAGKGGQARIYLFLGNIFQFAGCDMDLFREETRITFLHELGHFLELDEDELEARGLG